MSAQLNHLPKGPERPTQQSLDAFWAVVKAANPGMGDDYEVRWFGIDAQTTQGIFGYIKDGVKTATYSVPWLMERTGQPRSQMGAHVVLIDYDGTPTLVLEIKDSEIVAFDDIDERITHTDGLSIREPNLWKKIHKGFWNGELEPYGLEVTADMPVLVEYFELAYSTPRPDLPNQAGQPEGNGREQDEQHQQN